MVNRGKGVLALGLVALVCGCDADSSSFESAAVKPIVQDVADLESGDRLICIRAIADGRCTRSNAQAILTKVANHDDVAVTWLNDEKVRITVNSGKFIKMENMAMNGKVMIEYNRK